MWKRKANQFETPGLEEQHRSRLPKFPSQEESILCFLTSRPATEGSPGMLIPPRNPRKVPLTTSEEPYIISKGGQLGASSTVTGDRKSPSFSPSLRGPSLSNRYKGGQAESVRGTQP